MPGLLPHDTIFWTRLEYYSTKIDNQTALNLRELSEPMMMVLANLEFTQSRQP
jgi:hypothetical protein